MTKLYSLLLSLSIITISYSQEIDPIDGEIKYDKYYPENKFIRDNKIRFVIDSSEFYNPGGRRVKAYDTLGRIIGDFYWAIEKFDNPYSYKRYGDTLIRLKYRPDKTPFSSERFIYNAKGQIISYLDCSDYHFRKDKFTVTYEEFYYDEDGKLRAQLTWYKDDYNGLVSEKHSIPSSELELVDLVYYSSKTFKNGNKLIVGRHAAGSPDWRPTDSTIFDKKNRVIRFNSFAKRGSLGCPAGNHVNRIVEYQYSDTSMKITGYTTTCDHLHPELGCLLPAEWSRDVAIHDFDKANLKLRKYSIYQSGEKRLTDKYYYVFYE